MNTPSELEVDIDRLDRVVIAAAVAAVLGPSAQIRGIQPVSRRDNGSWMREGRLEVQSSHRMAKPLMRAARMERL